MTHRGTARESNSLATNRRKSSEDDSNMQESVSTDFFTTVAGEFDSPEVRNRLVAVDALNASIGTGGLSYWHCG